MNILLTGATGTLGSNLLYKLLLREDIEKLYLLVRDKKGTTAKARLTKILSSKTAPKEIRNSIQKQLHKIAVFNSDEFFKPENYIDTSAEIFCIHSAGFVNLSTNKAHKDEIFSENFDFTKRIFECFKPYVSKFVYISTAYSIGDIGGLIPNTFHTKNAKPNFRNFYEESKYLAEQYLLKNAKTANIQLQILRPSVLGGNIFENSQYFISKYMVYYLLAKFFHNNPFVNDSIRIAINKNTGLNIIPVDYAASIIEKAFTMNIKELNIVHSTSTNLFNGIQRIAETVNFKKLEIVSPSLNILESFSSKLETLYYNSIGIHLEPYLTSTPYEYDTRLLESILPIPLYDTVDYLEHTVAYAKERAFRNKRW
ncbi:SDR family oxidoreductase [Spongiivirga citrea]|uniref:NAD-dependent epimerase/dehydratase family protein n=1 Tax=Spongiivirga citrea TaxID=1481457 RepID=A0A6M0CQA3_9FLAO|nr:SDR family oxidoreductase [Spongiivirga citrea]NER18204.1 NAD-dependent epimerase/dehydratase family protein [Spongiivirga citrea]